MVMRNEANLGASPKAPGALPRITIPSAQLERAQPGLPLPLLYNEG